MPVNEDASVPNEFSVAVWNNLRGMSVIVDNQDVERITKIEANIRARSVVGEEAIASRRTFFAVTDSVESLWKLERAQCEVQKNLQEGKTAFARTTRSWGNMPPEKLRTKFEAWFTFYLIAAIT